MAAPVDVTLKEVISTAIGKYDAKLKEEFDEAFQDVYQTLADAGKAVIVMRHFLIKVHRIMNKLEQEPVQREYTQQGKVRKIF